MKCENAPGDVVLPRHTSPSLTTVAEQPLHRALGLTDGEFARIEELLGREPNHFELAVFSLLWSEHCGYKHSAPLLRRLPSSGERVLQGPGENAGVLDLGEGLAVAFKVESHNHPSQIEPFQGAATGVGGILRDIVAMGARPIALLDGLWFGAPGHDFDRAVAGIGHYGNCVGVPTVGGQTVWDEAYRGNCLVNAMCVGLLPVERVMSAKASGVGNLVVLYGATTGRDGIGGASVLASQELGEDDADKRPSVQVGDPFMGNKLIEVSVELVERGLAVSLQDCGAAGLASALSEMARDGMGVDVHLDRVPLREPDLEPWEIMISESQERMVAVVEPGRLAEVEELFDRWELHHATIGEVTDSGLLRALHDGDVAGEIPAGFLTDECPRYTIEQAPRASTRRGLRPRPAEPKRWIYEQYDQMVGSRTVRRPGLDAAVLRLRPSFRGLALSLQGPAPGSSIRSARASTPCSARRATSPARAGSRSGSPTASTSGTRKSPAPGSSSCTGSRASRRPPRRSACRSSPATCRSTTRPTAARSRPRPVVGCVGLVTDVRAIPDRWRPGDVVLSVKCRGRSQRARCARRLPVALRAASVTRPRCRLGGFRGRARRGVRVERLARSSLT